MSDNDSNDRQREPMPRLQEVLDAIRPARSHEVNPRSWRSALDWVSSFSFPILDTEFPQAGPMHFSEKALAVWSPARARGVHGKNGLVGLSFDTPGGVLRVYMTEQHAAWILVAMADHLRDHLDRRLDQSPSSSGRPSVEESSPPGPEAKA